MKRHPESSTGSWVNSTLALAIAVGLPLALAAMALFHATSRRPEDRGAVQPRSRVIATAYQPQKAAPDPFDGGTAWINSAPIKLRDLRGKIVLIDFWTYCCINCHHVLPDLARLEEKYKNELVVIGVHSPKFNAERDTENVRRKVREYGIKHPVISDADQVLWNRFGVNSWPTLGVFDPEGKFAFAIAGEGHYDKLDQVIGELVRIHREKGDLNESPVKFFPEIEKPDTTPLLFPGKLLADAHGRRLFVADTGHNRIIVSGLDGKSPTIIGTGIAGMADGPYEKARFQRPQGMVLVGQTLYVADTENHAIRAIDLNARKVTTIAGTGQQSTAFARPRVLGTATHTALSSPWDLAHVGDTRSLYIAMAGQHQIWRLDLETGKVGAWAGNGRENIVDGSQESAEFAQPSGLATDGTHLYVADSEVSAIRSISLANNKHTVRSIVGQGLFEFGDVDGTGHSVRLQHCLGLAYGGGKLYVADTYNNKVKVCDPQARSVTTLVGSGKPGDSNAPPQFYQPGGLSVAGTSLYVADTNNHAIRVVDLESETVTTLEIEGLTPPSPPKRKPTFPNLTVFEAKPADLAPGKTLTLNVRVPIPSGFKLNEEGSMPILVESPGQEGVIAYGETFPETGTKLETPVKEITLDVPLTGKVASLKGFPLKVSVGTFVCSLTSNLCTVKSYVWNVPVVVSDQGTSTLQLDATMP